MTRINLVSPVLRRCAENAFHESVKLLLGILTSISRACGWLRGAWINLGHLYQHWTINVVIGILIWIVTIVAHDSRIIVAAQNWALDAAMQGRAGMGEKKGSMTPPLTFIDIDEEMWRNPRWGGGEPPRAPRQGQRSAENPNAASSVAGAGNVARSTWGLLDVIDYALEHDARYLVLDVLVESINDPEDIKFAAAIEKRVAGLEKKGQHLFFARSLRDPLGGMVQLSPELRPSSVDVVIQTHLGHLHAVAPYFGVSRDGVLRDWKLWRAGCRRETEAGNGHWEILPSAQLAVAALLLSETDEQKAETPWNVATEVEPCIVGAGAFANGSPASPQAQPDTRVWNWLRKRNDLTGTSNLEAHDEFELANRIFFKFHFPPDPSQVRVIPAIRLLEPVRNENGFAGGLVVIGQSFEAARDQHATPLGVMPGAMVLVNSLDSMLDLKLLRPPGEVCKYLFELGSIILIGYVFARFDSFIATLVILITFVPLLLVLNYQLLRWSVWLDVSLPLLGIFAHRIIAGLEEYATRRIGGAHLQHHV
jgi:hypothetical protein